MTDRDEPSVPPSAEPAAAWPAAVFDVEGEPDHPELAYWQGNIGATLALDLAPPLTAPPSEFLLLSWNLAIGAARIAPLLARLRAGAFDLPFDPNGMPLVVAAQEAYREEATLAPPRGRYHGGLPRAPERTDIAALAHAEGMSLRYAPSMRNGLTASDRGNAVLSTAALAAGRGLLLPLVRQRRVAVAAEWAGVPGLRFVSAHLDTGGRPRTAGLAAERRYGSGRSAQARAIAAWIGAADAVVGADLNAPLGARDPALRAVVAAGLTAARPVRPWGHTFHGPLGVRLPLDFVLYRSGGRVADVEVHRLDENRADRSARVFGSDHHPLLARVRLADAPAPDPGDGR